MKDKLNRSTQISLRKGEVWNIKIGFFHPVLLSDPGIPVDVLYIKFQLLLN